MTTQIITIIVAIALIFGIFKAFGGNSTPQPNPPQPPTIPIPNSLSDNSKIPLAELVNICSNEITNKKAFAEKYQFKDNGNMPTPMGEMYTYRINSTTLYFTKYVVIYTPNHYSGNATTGSEYIKQAVSIGFSKILDRHIPDGHIVTYKKGDIHVDFKNPNSTLSIAVYKTTMDYKGDLNGMDYSNFNSSISRKATSKEQSVQEVNYDISKIKRTINESIQYVNSYTKNTEDLADKSRNQKGLDNIQLLQSKKQIPDITSIDSAIKILTIYNQNNINLYEYLNPVVLDEFLDVVTEDLYLNKNKGKSELVQLFTGIGMPTDEISMNAMACIMKFLAKKR